MSKGALEVLMAMVSRSKVFTRIMAVLALVLVASVPEATSAAPNQEKSSREQRDEVRQRQGEVSGEVDVLEAANEELIATLVALETEVANHAAELEEADRAAADAAADLRDAEQAVAEAELRIAALDQAIDKFVVEAYINPPAEGMFDALSAETMTDAVVKRVLIELQSDSDADLIDQFELAHEDLELERANQQEIAAEAEAKRQAAAAKLEELQAAQSQQAAFAADAEEALERKLAEVATLAEHDRELSERIQQEDALIQLARELEAQRQREEEARRQREAAAAASGGGSSDGAAQAPARGGGGAPAATVTPAPGGLASVNCPRGGSITVAGSIASSVGALLDHAWRDGIGLCGWGYRDPERQIELRRQHCGTSHYAIYEAPASSCSPPTARPGQSMHERGLAVDFTCNGGSIGTRSSPCYQWLNRHASGYGLYNLPSEPWHWSVNGS